MEAINGIQKQLDRLKLAITGQRNFVSDNEESVSSKVLQELDGKDGVVMKNTQEKVIEGVFDGQNMIGADGQQYDVPANYASKSKLVEGDILKLTINNIGAFLYKQIKPIDRMRLVGTLEQDSQNMQYFAVSGNKRWRLLTASVTYFHGEAGDEVVFFVPNEGMSRWAAVENIIQK
ncbi:hypothetical protein A2533_03195 [Candidatus Falkowbacteria bacterium RIFOXYD2_FULL_35_9]|uniref:50S ribosomal protein L7/L12 n=1 Tax=Candidatus Falkowbacteria bacterium RIFOXYC2_FULL_36_12 TaxID=1798002 RepID=A0A1F5SWZ0_9BACT|nr:MAG: hypothetical protein A2478_00265 [Candidatus Falkowbacteria bacterium RIFOXYC2_FULL_36_12]OGF34261.1 MAG: hypothetical protein A2223_04625 [Candidatus Falkowbacteria bacterium RIFOXYA2_FULL_35_8]OGF46978.1 MAG: hypothetical protein A2533_03195 [Candidatus Falkowbacteria bacterium RIFOXYD2_FULL_35_9]